MGNPNPSPATRFKAGVSGNPSGKSSEQLIAENKAARIAADLRLKALSCLQEIVSDEAMTPEEIHKALTCNENLKLFKDSEDRAHGTPKATSEINADLTHRDGTDYSDSDLESIIAKASGD